jgi:hypothetical protein
MEPLFIPATKGTPEIAIDAQTASLSVKGMSIPENAAEFYAPVIQVLEQVLNTAPAHFNAHFDLSYFNSSSLKALYMVLQRLKESRIMGATLSIEWVVEEEDEFMLEASQYFCDLLGIDMQVKHVPVRDHRERKAS